MAHSFLNLFGCCGENTYQRERKITKAILLGPTTTMNLQTSPNRPFGKLYPSSGTHGRNGIQYKEDFEDNFDSKSIIRVYPSNEVFILGDKYKIVAYITKKKIDKENSIQVSLRESLSSLIKENVRNNSNSNTSSKAKWSNLVKNCASIENKKDLSAKEDKLASSNASYNGNPESLGSYLANRLRCDVLVDAVCGFGEITKYFGGSCNYVVAFEKDAEKILSAKNLAETQELGHKIDFINADFTDVNGFQADIVFLDPADVRVTLDQSFSISEDLSPKLDDVLLKALKIAKGSVVIKLPGDTNLQELPKLFYDVFRDDDSMDLKRYCIEIEEIVNINQEVENIMVYFGNCSTIEVSEEYGAIYDYLSSTQQPKWRFKFPLQVVTFILEKVGSRNSLQFITEIEEFAATHTASQFQYSFFDIFLEKVIGENILTKQEIAQLIKEESKRPSSFIFSIANSYASRFTLLDHSNSAVSSQYNLVETVEENRGKKVTTKNQKQGGRNSVSEIPFEGFSQLHSQDNTTQPSHKDTQNKSSNFYSGFAHKKPFSFKDLAYNGEGSMTPSCEVSHLENYLSSDNEEYIKEYKENGMSGFKVFGKSKGEIAHFGNLTPEDIGLDSPGLLPINKKTNGNYRSSSRSSKWKEFKSDSLVNEEVQFELVENKENDGQNKNNNQELENEIENINKSDFFVKKKNVFLENGVKQGE